MRRDKDKVKGRHGERKMKGEEDPPL